MNLGKVDLSLAAMDAAADTVASVMTALLVSSGLDRRRCPVYSLLSRQSPVSHPPFKTFFYNGLTATTE